MAGGSGQWSILACVHTCVVDVQIYLGLYISIIMSRSRYNETSTHIPLQLLFLQQIGGLKENWRFGRGMIFSFHFAILVVGEVLFLSLIANIRALVKHLRSHRQKKGLAICEMSVPL